MRKLKLQVHMTLDGFVVDTNGRTDWVWELTTPPDPAGLKAVTALAASCDTLLLGRKMTREFVDHWENIVDNKPHGQQELAQLLVDIRKIVFSRTQTHIPGRNVEVTQDDLAATVEALKQLPGKDILAYGGASFVRSLVALNLVDEYHIISSPIAIGEGVSIFTGKKLFQVVSQTLYTHGKTLTVYIPC